MSLFSFLFCTLFLQAPVSDTGLYSIQFNSIDDGTVINMSDYTNKQIIVIEFDAANPNQFQLQSLDTLYKNENGQLIVIAVPVQDFNGTMQQDSLLSLLRNTFSLSYIISESSYGQKVAGSLQHPLLEWLTNANENLHFDDEITGEGQMYVISSAGILYGLLYNDIRPNDELMQSILNNPPNP